MWVAQRDGDYVNWRGEIGETFSFMYQRKSHIDFSTGWSFSAKVWDETGVAPVVLKGTFSITNSSTPDYLTLTCVIANTTTAAWTGGDQYAGHLVAYKGTENSPTERYVLERFRVTPMDRLGD